MSFPACGPVLRTRLPGDERAASAARSFVRTVLFEQARTVPAARAAVGGRLDDAVLLASELVTNAVVHAGTEIEVVCALEYGGAAVLPAQGAGLRARQAGYHAPPPDEPPTGVLVEVADRHPSRVARGVREQGREGRGLRLVQALAESWGVTFRRDGKSVWFRLDTTTAGGTGEPRGPLDDVVRRQLHLVESLAPAVPRHREEGADWAGRAGPSFLAEASELLGGQLDDDRVAALTGQLLVPRVADWCGVWLSTESGGMRLSRVWHVDERRIGALRAVLEKDPPAAGLRATVLPWPWPPGRDPEAPAGSALAVPLVAGGRAQGVLVLGRAGQPGLTEGAVRLVEDVARRVAQAVVAARQYTRQAVISRALQRRQLPVSIAGIPGMETAVVYEPYGEGQTVGGDFYDLFPRGDRRWCFLLGDVCGNDPDAMSVTGLARHLVRLLARERHGVESVLGRLNTALAEESAEAAACGADEGRPSFLSMIYGEVEPDPVAGGALCTVASAGHPLPLLLRADGTVEAAADPQMLLGIDGSTGYHARSFRLAPGETLLCVTDGVTERRDGTRLLDDDDGLREVLRGCAGLGARAVAERVRRVAHDFGAGPLDDDLAVLVLQATARTGPASRG